jgi:hypothetical protein
MRWLLLAIIAIVVVGAVVRAQRRRRRIVAQAAAFVGAHKGWEIFISPVDGGVIAVDQDAAALILGSTAAWTRYGFDDISVVELLRDGNRVAIAKRGSPPPGATLGADFFVAPKRASLRPAGGGKEPGIRSIEIEVIIDDPQSPDHLIQFFRSSSPAGVYSGAARLMAALESANRLGQLLFTAIGNQRRLEATPLGASQEFARLRQLSEGTGPPLEEFLERWATGHPPSGEPDPAASA